MARHPHNSPPSPPTTLLSSSVPAASAPPPRPPGGGCPAPARPPRARRCRSARQDRKSTRLNSSHSQTSYAVFCLKKKKGRRMSEVHDEMKRVPYKVVACPHD